MALGRCQDCRESMSDSAESCPHCGSTRRPTRTVAKKIVGNVVCDNCHGYGYYFIIHHTWMNKPFSSYDDYEKVLYAHFAHLSDNKTEANSRVTVDELEAVKKFILEGNWHQLNNEIHSIREEQCSSCNGTGTYYVREEYGRIEYRDEEM